MGKDQLVNPFAYERIIIKYVQNEWHVRVQWPAG
jgi:hypothetical protein